LAGLPQTALTDNPVCPACNGAPRQSYFRHGQWQLYTCASCGLIYLDPAPAPETLAALYNDAYQGTQTGYFAKPELKLRRSLIRVRIIQRYVKSGAGNFLDIGCNGGFMVEAARRKGFTGWGIDLDPVSIDYARRSYPGNQFFYGPVSDFDPRDPQGAPVTFAAAYCSEVIEHVPEPQGFLWDIYRLLSPGGVLYLTTPDISHWRRPRRLLDWDAFCPPSHLLYFNPRNLIALAERCGFELISRRPAWKPGIKLIVRRPA